MSKLQHRQITLILSRNMAAFMSSSGRWKRSGIIKQYWLAQSTSTPEVMKILMTNATCIWRKAASIVRLLQTHTVVALVLYSLKTCSHQALFTQVATEDKYFPEEPGKDSMQAGCREQSCPPPCGTPQAVAQAQHQPQAMQQQRLQKYQPNPETSPNHTCTLLTL